MPQCILGCFLGWVWKWSFEGSMDPGQERLTRNICFSFGRRAWTSRADTCTSLVTGSVPFCYVPNHEELESAQKPKNPKLSHYWLIKAAAWRAAGSTDDSGPKQTMFIREFCSNSEGAQKLCRVEKCVNESTGSHINEKMRVVQTWCIMISAHTHSVLLILVMHKEKEGKFVSLDTSGFNMWRATPALTSEQTHGTLYKIFCHSISL